MSLQETEANIHEIADKQGFSLSFRPGPRDRTLWAFMNSRAEVRGIMGPVGSAKTSVCLLDGLRNGVAQMPSPIDGVRYSRMVTIRDTYRQLERSTIPSWHEWVPKEIGRWTGGSSGEPAKHIITSQMQDGSRMHFEHWFAALGEQVDLEAFWRGFHVTFIYVNEADTVSIDVVQVGRTRLGRYPAMRHGGPTWRGIWCDFNAPNYGDDICNYFIEERDPSVDFFRQPGGRDPDAENIENLPPGYYEDQCKGQDEYWVKRMVDNELGHSRQGKPVHPEFAQKLHVAKSEVELIGRRPLYVGLDAGRTPAASGQQRDMHGQVRILRELVTDGIGAQSFGIELKHWLADHFPGMDVIGICDPAAAEPDQSSNKDDDAWMDIVSNEAEILIRPAPSNKPTDRREALKQPMQRMIAPDKPGLIVDPSCKMTIRGLTHGWKYKKIQGTKDLYHTKPDKEEFSHICEAAEYGALGSGTFKDLRRRRDRRGAKPLPKTVKWRPRAVQ